MPLAPPVIKIVLLVSFIIKYLLMALHVDETAQNYVDPRRCDLPRKFLADSGRGTRDERPRTESFLVNLGFHVRVFVLRFKARSPATAASRSAIAAPIPHAAPVT